MSSFRSVELGEGDYFFVEDGKVKKTTDRDAKSPIAHVAQTALMTQGSQQRLESLKPEMQLSFRDWVNIKKAYDNRFKNLHPVMRAIARSFEKMLDVFRSSRLLKNLFSLSMSSKEIEDGLRKKISDLDPQSIIGRPFLRVDREKVTRTYTRQERSRLDDFVSFIINNPTCKTLSFVDVLQMEKALCKKKSAVQAREHLKNRKDSLLESAKTKPREGTDPIDDILLGYFLYHPVTQSMSRSTRSYLIHFVKARIASRSEDRIRILDQLKDGDSSILNSIMMSCIRQSKKMQKTLADGAMALVIVGQMASVTQELQELVQFLQKNTYKPRELASRLQNSKARLDALTENEHRTENETIELSLLHLLEAKALFHSRKIAPKTVTQKGRWFRKRFEHAEVSVSDTLKPFGVTNSDLLASKLTGGASIPLAHAGIEHIILRKDKKTSFLVAKIEGKSFVFTYNAVSGELVPYKNKNDVEARLCLARALLSATSLSEEQIGIASDLLNTNFTAPHATELTTKDPTTQAISKENREIIKSEVELAREILHLSLTSPDGKVVQLKVLAYLSPLLLSHYDAEIQESEQQKQAALRKVPPHQKSIDSSEATIALTRSEQNKESRELKKKIKELLTSIDHAKLLLGQEEWRKLHPWIDSDLLEGARSKILEWDPSAYSFLLSPEMVMAHTPLLPDRLPAEEPFHREAPVQISRAVALLQELCYLHSVQPDHDIATRAKTLLDQIGDHISPSMLHLSPQYFKLLLTAFNEPDRTAYILKLVDWDPTLCLSEIEVWRTSATRPNPHTAALLEFTRKNYSTSNAKVKQLQILSEDYAPHVDRVRALSLLEEIAKSIDAHDVPTEMLRSGVLPLPDALPLADRLQLAKRLFAWEPAYLFEALKSCSESHEAAEVKCAGTICTTLMNEKHFSVDAVAVQLRAYCYLQSLDPSTRDMDRDDRAKALVEKLIERTSYTLTADEETELKKLIPAYNKEARAKLQNCCEVQQAEKASHRRALTYTREELSRIPQPILKNKNELYGFYTHNIRPALFGEPNSNPDAIPRRVEEWEALSEFLEPSAFDKAVQLFLKDSPSLLTCLLSSKMAENIKAKLNTEQQARYVALFSNFARPGGPVITHAARLQALLFIHSLNSQFDITPIGRELLREMALHCDELDLNTLKRINFSDREVINLLASLSEPEQKNVTFAFVDANPDFFLSPISRMGLDDSLVPFIDRDYISQDAKVMQVRLLNSLVMKRGISQDTASIRICSLFQEIAREALRGNRSTLQFTEEERTYFCALFPDLKEVIDVATSYDVGKELPEMAWEKDIQDSQARKDLRDIAKQWGIDAYVYCPEGVEPPPLHEGKEHEVRAAIEKWECAKTCCLYPAPMPKGDPEYRGIIDSLQSMFEEVESDPAHLAVQEKAISNVRDEVMKKLEDAQDEKSRLQAEVMALMTEGRSDPESIGKPLPSLETLYVLYSQNNFDELGRFGIDVTPDSVRAYKEKISALLSAIQKVQKANRVLNSIHELIGAARSKNCSLFIETITKERGALDWARGMTEYDPALFPAFQVYEVFIDSLVTRKQFENISQLMGSGNVLLQQLMGSGKTFILIPLLALAAADGDNIAIAMFPDPLLKTNLAEIQEKLGGAMRELVIEQPEINSSMSVGELKALHDLLLNVRQKRGILFFSPEKMHVLLNTQVNMIEDIRAKTARAKTLAERAKTDEQAAADLTKVQTEISEIQAKLKEVTAILTLLKEKGAVIGDEADELFKTSLQYIISVGDAESVSEGDSEMIGELIFQIMEHKDEWPASLDFLRNVSSSPYLTFEQYGQRFLPILRTSYVDKMKNNFINTREAIAELLLNPSSNELLIAYFKKESIPERKHIEELLKRLPIAVRDELRKAATEDPSRIVSILNRYQEEVLTCIQAFTDPTFVENITANQNAYVSFNMRDGDSNPRRAREINTYIDSLPTELAQKVRDMRRVLFHTLHSALNSHCNEEYGVVDDQVKPWPSPFSGPKCPAKTQFSSPPELIIKTIQAYTNQGIPPKYFQEAFKNMTDQEVQEFFRDLPEFPHVEFATRETYLKAQLEHVNALRQVMLSSKKAVSVDQSGRLSSDEVNKRKAFIIFLRKFVATCTYPLVDEHKASIVSNSQKLWYGFRSVKAFTGTLWNKSTQPTWRAIYPDSWTAGSFFMRLFRKSRQVPPEISTHYCGSKHEHIPNLHKLIKDLKARTLIDNGGWLRDTDEIKQFAIDIFNDNEEIKSVVYHGLDKRLYVLRRGLTEPELFSTSESKKADSGRFTIYAKQYCVGTDIKQIPDALAIQTIGPGMIDRDAAQGTSRMRQVSERQKVIYAFSDEEVESLQGSTGKRFNVSEKKPTEGPQFLDFILGFVYQEADVRLSQNQQSTRERMKCQIEDKFRTLIGKKIMEGKFDEVLLIYEKARDYFVTTRGKDEKEHIQFHAATKDRMEQEIREMMKKFTGVDSDINWEGVPKDDLEELLRSVIRYHDLPEKMTEEDQKKDPVLDVGIKTQRAAGEEAAGVVAAGSGAHVRGEVKVEPGVVRQVAREEGVPIAASVRGKQTEADRDHSTRLATLAQTDLMAAYERVKGIDEASLQNKPQTLARVREIKRQGKIKQELDTGSQQMTELAIASGFSEEDISGIQALFHGELTEVFQARQDCLKNLCARPLEVMQRIGNELEKKDVLGLCRAVDNAVKVRMALQTRLTQARTQTDAAKECQAQAQALADAAVKISQGVSDEDLAVLEQTAKAAEEENQKRAGTKENLHLRQDSIAKDLPASFAPVQEVLGQVDLAGKDVAENESLLTEAEAGRRQCQAISGQGEELAKLAQRDSAWNELVQQNAALMAQVSRAGLKDGSVQQNIEAMAAAITAMRATLARREGVLAQARASAERPIEARNGSVLERDQDGYQKTLQELRDAKASCRRCSAESPEGQTAVDAQIGKLQEFQTRIETLEGELAAREEVLAKEAKASLQTSALSDLQALEQGWQDDLNGLTKAEVHQAVQARETAQTGAQALDQMTDAFTSADKATLGGFLGEIHGGVRDERLAQIHDELQAMKERLEARAQAKATLRTKMGPILENLKRTQNLYLSVRSRMNQLSGQIDAMDVDQANEELKKIGDLAKRYDKVYGFKRALAQQDHSAFQGLKAQIDTMLTDLDSSNEAFEEHLATFEQEQAALPEALQTLSLEEGKARELFGREIEAHEVSEQLSQGALNDTYQRQLEALLTAKSALEQSAGREVKSLADVQAKSQELQEAQAAYVARQTEVKGTEALLESQHAAQVKIEQARHSMDESSENQKDEVRLGTLADALLQAPTAEKIQEVQVAVREVQARILARNEQKAALQGTIQAKLDALGEAKELAGARGLLQRALKEIHQRNSSELQAMLDKAERLKTQASELLRHQGSLPSTDQDLAWGPVHQFAEELQATLDSENELEEKDFKALQEKREAVFHVLLSRNDMRSEVFNFVMVKNQQASGSIAKSAEYQQYVKAHEHVQDLHNQMIELSKNRPGTVEEVQAQTRQLQALLAQCKEQKKKTSAQLGAVRQAVLQRIETDRLDALVALSHELEGQDFLGLRRRINEAVQEKTKVQEDAQSALTNVDLSKDGEDDKNRLEECLQVIQGATTKHTLAELRDFIKGCVQRNEERKAAKTKLVEQLNALKEAATNLDGVRTTVQNAIDKVATLPRAELQAAIEKARQLQSRYEKLLGLEELFQTRAASAYTEVRGQVQAERDRLGRAEDVDETRFVALHQSIQAVEASLNECETQFIKLRQLKDETVESFTSHGLAKELCDAHAQAGRKLTSTQGRMQEELEGKPQSQAEVVAQIARCKALAEQYVQEKAQVALARQVLIDSLVQGIQQFTLEQIDDLASHDLIKQLQLTEQFQQAKAARHQSIDRAQQTHDAMDESQEMAESREQTLGLINEIKRGVTDIRLAEINDALRAQQAVNEARQKERAALIQGISELNNQSGHPGVKARLRVALTEANKQNTADLQKALEEGTLLHQQYEDLKAQVGQLAGKNDASMAMIREQADRLKEQLDRGEPLAPTAIQDLADMRKKLEAAVQERDDIKARAVDEFRQAPAAQAAIFREETESFSKCRDAFAQAEAAKAAYEEEAGKAPANLAGVEEQVARLTKMLHAYRQLTQSAEVLREAYIRETVEKDVRALREAAPTGLLRGLFGGGEAAINAIIEGALKNHGADAEQVLADAQKALLSQLDTEGMEKAQKNSISKNLQKRIERRFDQLHALGFGEFEKSDVARLTAERDRLKADLMNVNKAFSEETEASIGQFKAKRDALIGFVREQRLISGSLVQGQPGSAVASLQAFLQNEVRNALSKDEVTLETIAQAQAKLQSLKGRKKAQEDIARQADSFEAEVNQEKGIAKAQRQALLSIINEIKANPGRAEELKDRLEAQHKEFSEAVAMEKIETQLTRELFGDQAKMSRTLQNFASVFKRMEGQAAKQQALQEKLIQWWQQSAADMREHVFAQVLSEKLRRMTEATAALTAQELFQGLEQLKACQHEEQQASESFGRLETFQRALLGAAQTLNIQANLSLQAIQEQKRRLDQQRQAADTPEKMAAAIQAHRDFLAVQEAAKNGLQESMTSVFGLEIAALAQKNDSLAEALQGKPGVNDVKARVGTRLQAARKAVESGNQQAIEAAVQAMRQAEVQYTEKLTETLQSMSLAELLSLSGEIRGGEFRAQIDACIGKRVHEEQEQFRSSITALQREWSTEAEKSFRDGLSQLDIQNAKTPTEFSALDGKIKAVERERAAYIQRRGAIRQEVESIRSQNIGVAAALQAIRDNLTRSSIEELQAKLQHARDLEGQYGQVATAALSDVQPFSQGGVHVLQEESSKLEATKGNLRAQLDQGTLVDSRLLNALHASVNQAKEQVVAEDRKALEQLRGQVGQLENFAHTLPERLSGPILRQLQSLRQSGEEGGMTQESFGRLLASMQDQDGQIKGGIGFLSLDEVKSVQANKNALFRQELSDRLDQCIANRKTTIEQGRAGLAGALKSAESELNRRLQTLAGRLDQAKETVDFDQLEQELHSFRQEHERYMAARQHVAEFLQQTRKDTQGMDGVEVLCRHVEENLDNVAPHQLQEELDKAGELKSQYTKLTELQNGLDVARPFSQAGIDQKALLQQALQKQIAAKRATMRAGTPLDEGERAALERTVKEDLATIQRADNESLQSLSRRGEARDGFIQALGNRQLIQQQEAIATLLRRVVTAESYADMVQKGQELDRTIDKAISQMTFADVDRVLKVNLSSELRAKVEQRKQECLAAQHSEVESIKALMKQGYQPRTKAGMAKQQQQEGAVAERAKTIQDSIKRGIDASAPIQSLREEVQRAKEVVEQEDSKVIRRVTQALDEAERTANRNSVRVQQLLRQARDAIAQNAFGAVDDILKSVQLANRLQQQFSQASDKLHQIEGLYQQNAEVKRFYDAALSSAIRPLLEGSKQALTEEDDRYSQRSIDELQREIDRLEHDMIEITNLLQSGLSLIRSVEVEGLPQSAKFQRLKREEDAVRRAFEQVQLDYEKGIGFKNQEKLRDAVTLLERAHGLVEAEQRKIAASQQAGARSVQALNAEFSDKNSQLQGTVEELRGSLQGVTHEIEKLDRELENASERRLEELSARKGALSLEKAELEERLANAEKESADFQSGSFQVARKWQSILEKKMAEGADVSVFIKSTEGQKQLESLRLIASADEALGTKLLSRWEEADFTVLEDFLIRINAMFRSAMHVEGHSMVLKQLNTLKKALQREVAEIDTPQKAREYQLGLDAIEKHLGVWRGAVVGKGERLIESSEERRLDGLLKEFSRLKRMAGDRLLSKGDWELSSFLHDKLALLKSHRQGEFTKFVANDVIEEYSRLKAELCRYMERKISEVSDESVRNDLRDQLRTISELVDQKAKDLQVEVRRTARTDTGRMLEHVSDAMGQLASQMNQLEVRWIRAKQAERRG